MSFPVSFACAVDSKVHVAQSIASVKVNKFKLFSGFDDALDTIT